MDPETSKVQSSVPVALGVTIIVLSIATIISLFVFVHRQLNWVECQTRVNVIFLDTIKERADIFEDSDRAIRDLAVKAFSARNDSEMLNAYKRYLTIEEQLDKRREAAAYPNIEEVCVE